VLFLLWRRNAKTLIFAALLAAGALFALPGAVYDRIATGYGEGLNVMSAGRIEEIWLPLLPEVLRSPIYGSGLGSMLWSETMRAGTTILGVTQAHNAYLETVLDMGIAGLILVCTYFVHLWKGFRALGADPSLSPTLRGFFQGAAAGLASLLVAGIVGSRLTPGAEQVFLWLAIGMMYGQRARNTGDLKVSRQYVDAGSRAQSA
jgi:O-antigen ligase